MDLLARETSRGEAGMIGVPPFRPTILWDATPVRWRWMRAALVAYGVLAALLIATQSIRTSAAVLVGLALAAIVLRFPIAGIVMLVFSVPWGSELSVHGGSSPITPTELLVALLGVAWLGVSVRDRRNPIPRTLWTPYVLAFIAVIAFSVTVAIDLRSTLPEILKWLEMAAVYFMTVRFVRTRRALYVVVAAVVLAGVSQALLGYAQFLFQLGPAAFGAHRPFFRSYGTFDQPNPFAGFLNMTLPMAIAGTALAGRRIERRLALWSTLLIAAALLSSQSRGALLAGSVATGVLLCCLYLWARRAAGPVAVAASVTGLAGVYNLLPSGPIDKALSTVGLGNVSFGNVTNANFSAVERAAHWLAGVRMFAAHPLLGVGIGNYAAAYPRYHPRGWYASLEHAHNYYINIAAEAGIAGLTAYTLMVGSALWYSYATIRQVNDRLMYAAALGVLGALVATSFHNFFDVLYVHGMAAFMGLLVGLLPACRELGMNE
jgi:O-antigen ligase